MTLKEKLHNLFHHEHHHGHGHHDAHERLYDTEEVDFNATGGATTTTTTVPIGETKEEVIAAPVAPFAPVLPVKQAQDISAAPRVLDETTETHTEVHTEVIAQPALPVAAESINRTFVESSDGTIRTTDVIELGKEPVVKTFVAPPTEDFEVHNAAISGAHTTDTVEKHFHHEHFIKPPPVKDVQIQEHHHYHTEVLPADRKDVVVEEHHHHHQKVMPPEVIHEKRDVHIDHVQRVKPATIEREVVQEFESVDKEKVSKKEAALVEQRGSEFFEVVDAGRTRDLKEVDTTPVVRTQVLPPTSDHETHDAVGVQPVHQVERVEKHLHHDHVIKPAPIKEIEVQEHHHYHREMLPPDEHEVVVREHHHHHEKVLPAEHVVERKDIHIDHVDAVKPERIEREIHTEIKHEDYQELDAQGNVINKTEQLDRRLDTDALPAIVPPSTTVSTGSVSERRREELEIRDNKTLMAA